MINLPLTFTISTLDFFYRKYRVHVQVYLLLYRIYMFTSCPQLTSIQDIRTQPRVPPSPPLSSQVYGQHQCRLSCPCYTLVYWVSIMFYGVCGPALYLWGHPFNLSLWHNPPIPSQNDLLCLYLHKLSTMIIHYHHWPSTPNCRVLSIGI